METELLELFESVKKAADAAAAADGASSNGPEVDRCIDALKTLKKFPVSYDALVSAQGLTRMIFNSAHILWARDSVGFGGMGKNGSYYALNLESISVNGHALPINRSAFATSADRRVVVDSGTALIYLVAGAYDVIINAIIADVTYSPTLQSEGSLCFQVTTNIKNIFPIVGLNFIGGSSWNLRPTDYLLNHGFTDSDSLWCIAIQRIDEGPSIIGDLAMKDKVIVYDLAQHRIGWVDYDCSSANFNVTLGNNNSRRSHVAKSMMTYILSVFLLLLL